MLHIIHNHLLAYVKRRQQIFEFHDLHDQYLEDDIAATPAHDIIQLRLVSVLNIRVCNSTKVGLIIN